MTNNNNNENKLKLRSSKCSMEIENTQKQQLIDSAMAKNDAQKQINKKNSSITSNGSLKIVADSNSNNVSVNKTKKKRRRIVNKTGFTKPRKRNKKLPNKIPVISKIVENNDNDDNDDCNRKNEQELMPSKSSENEKFNEKIPNIGSKIKVKKKKKKKLKDASSSSSATTASCCSSSECETIDKLKEKKKKKKKISRKSYFDSDSASTTTTSKYSSSIMTESTTATTTTSTESQEDDSDYPIYMVTAPSNKNLNRHKKVYPIKSNPFIRPIPSKKYYQTGLYSDEFMEMYSECAQSDNKSNKNKSNNDDSLVKDENSAKTSVESNELSNKLPILPFPPMCLSSSTTENEEKIDSEKKSSKLKRLDAIRRKYLPKNMDFNQDFQLSFDIWYQYKYNPFPLLMSSANYRRVRQNVFVDVKPIAADSHQACNCTMPRTPNEMACGADCINRMMYQECWPQTCPAKDRCSNQRIQKHQWSPGLERFMTRHRGWGIRTTEKIRKSEFILEYIGEIVSDRLFLKRMNERYNNDQHHYCLKIEPGVVIDGYRVGNEGRFVNHSCEPNCEMQKWAVNGYYRICMFALRDIEPMEELFYDYNFHNFNVETKQICHCGSSKCRGFINGKNSNISTKMTNGMMIANNNDNNMDINHNDLNQFSNHSSIIDDHQHSNKIIVEFPYAFLKSYACLPPNDPLGRNFVYMHKKSRKIKVPINFIKNIYNYTKKYDQQQLQSQKENLVEIFYDPKMLKKKMEPLSYTKKQKILRDSLFMLRNFEKKRKYYLSLQNFLDNQQTENNIYNHHRIRYQSSDLTNGSDSESSTTANRLLTSNCSIKTRGISRVDNDPNSKFIKLLQIYTNICEEIGLFIYKKLHSLLSSDDNDSKINHILNKNLTNGFMTDDDSDDYKTDNNKVNNHGAVKRKRKTNDKSHCANNFNEKLNGYELIDNNLMNFTSLLEQIRMNGKLVSLDLFEKSMILHLKKQFDDIRFDVKNVDHLKLKKLKLNGFKDEEYCKTEDSAKNIGLNEINLIEAETYRLLSNKLEQKYAIIENILHSKMINNVKKKELINDSITMINKVKNELEDNHEKLNETNQAKLNSFIELLQSNEPIPLSDHFSLTRIVESSLPKKKEKLEMNQNKIDDNQLSNIKGKNPEDIIRCICGILREEGQMIQCDKCEIWQHFDCVQQFSEVNLNEHEYVCEVCQPRFIPKDIPLPNNPPNFEMPFSLKFYLTLESPIEKGLRIRLGDCVYIYRQSPNPITSKQLSGKKNSDIKQIDSEHFIETIRTAANNAIRTRSTPFERKQCIIIRVQHLAIIEKTGQKILFGHHYIWPSETYHEPTRKFYPNELLRSPLCEWAAMEEVRKTCMILDPNTYQKGRPIGYDPEDIFICEMRVDRGAKSFSRIPKSAHFPINTKSYAFEYYTEKIKIKRTYSPHELPEPPKKTKSKDRKDNKTDQVLLDNQDDSTVSSMTTTIIKVPEMDEKVKKSKMLRLWQLSNRLIENAYCHQLLKEQQNKMEED
uniref:Bromo Adjacent Homology (BAH) domain contaning protein n=1 Tax=Psoroptes ovis TaxID=83912 RepID=A0A3B0QP03_PSOOV|nr:Bromo Adjacent Homology (BAH) domain contaning protein [Psoroptes ovis]